MEGDIMCWRDDVPRTRDCVMCGEKYFGPLGHLGCPGRPKQEKEIAIKKKKGGKKKEK